MSRNSKKKLKYSMYQSPEQLNQFSNNNNSFNSLNTSSFKLQKIFSEDLAWETPVVKQFILIYWVKLNIQEKENNFITTRQMYETYSKDCEILHKKVILTKASFYRLIWNSLLTAKIMYIKCQENGQKGIRGIQFKSTENYSKKIYNGQEIVP